MENIETKAVDMVAKLSPWFAPIPTSYLLSRATIIHLSWPLPIAIIAALVIETLGLATTATALLLYQYNRSKRKVDPPAPFKLASILVVFYFVIATGLTVVLDTYPGLATYAPAVFPSLSLTGVAVLALRSDHKQRLETITQERAERKANRQVASSSKQRSVSNKAVNMSGVKEVSVKRPSNIDILQASRRAKLEGRLDTLLNLLADNPHLPITEAAKLVGVSRQTLYTYIDALQADGKLSKNGHGWEVVSQ